MKNALIAAAVLLMLGATAGDAATTFRVTALRSGAGLYVTADTPKLALVEYFRQFGVALPAWAAIVSVERVCRSTHRIVNGAVVKFGYDQRTNPNGCP
jgi:hypothetical protein